MISFEQNYITRFKITVYLDMEKPGLRLMGFSTTEPTYLLSQK